MDNMFAGIEDVEREGTRERRPYFQDGDYLVALEAFKAFESTHPDTEGEQKTVVECTVVEVVNAFPTSNQAGQGLAWHNSLERNRAGKLTEKGKRGMGRIKNFAAAVLGNVPDEAITASVLGDMTSDPEGLAGTVLIARARTRVSAKTGKPFTTVTWEYPE